MWNLNTQLNGLRKKRQQNWEVGNTVKVGFLTLKITHENQYIQGYDNKGYLLTSLDGSKEYAFVPHYGLIRL